MKRRFLALTLALILCLCLAPVSALALEAQAYKPTITKVSVGAPITGLDGKKYIPVDVHFTSEGDPDESGKSMLEGVIKAVHDGVEDYVQGVGMTLMKVGDTPGNNQFYWDPNTKKGVAKFNVPVLDNGEAQTSEQSQATGQVEVNGLKEGDTAKLSLEAWVYGAEGTPVIPSNEAVFVYKSSELPKVYSIETFDITESWQWRFNAANHWEVCTEGDSLGQTREEGPHTYEDSAEAEDFAVSLPEGFDESRPLGPENSPTLTDGEGNPYEFDAYGFKSLNTGAASDDSAPAPAPVYLSTFAGLKAEASVKAKSCDRCGYAKLEGGVSGQVEGAAVSADKMTAQEGQQVNISVTPEEGQEIESVTAKSNGQDVPVAPKNAANGIRTRSNAVEFYYTQPAGSVVVTVTMKEPCEHPDAVTAFDAEGHWLYCPDCGQGIEDSYVEHRLLQNETITNVRMTVPNSQAESLLDLPPDTPMGVGNTVQFIGENKTFTYLPDDSGRISCQDDESDSLWIPGGFAASPDDPHPEFTNKYAVMVPGASMDMWVEYEDCGYGFLEIGIAHGDHGKIWADSWFVAAGETVHFGAGSFPGYGCRLVVRSGDREIPYEVVYEDMEYSFTMPAGTVVIEPEFYELPALRVPQDTLTLGTSAFENCGAYVVYIPEGCTTIGPAAFMDCKKLQVIHIPASVTEIDDTAFDGCGMDLWIYGEKGSAAEEFCRHHGPHFHEEGTEW